MSEIRIIPIKGLPEIVPGDDIAELVAGCAGEPLTHNDVVVVAQKIVSKSEDRFVPAGDRGRVIEAAAARILRRSGEMIIAETHHGFVCANAGVDGSNVPGDKLLLLPADPDLSARRIRARLEDLLGVRLGVVVSDTFGRAWRLGQTNIAIGVAGFEPFVDLRGATDAGGRELTATRICVADEIAAAAEMVMGKINAVPVAVVRGASVAWGRGSARDIVRPFGQDLFR
ncbi:MAG TPA: coenzyme F420-0:L-glutamate ligase [Actinomycetota bacterium]|nr:coenzyme F420-0:L-glutamate ligase [Actinomycetota bacterium]